MAKRITKPKVEKLKVKTSQEDTITGNLFLNPPKIETETCSTLISAL
jgi:hypothetical protein